MSEFIKSKAKILLKILIIIAAFVAVSLISMLILMAFGIIYFEDGINLNIELFNSFKNSWYGWIIIILLQVVITTLLSFIPGTSMAFIILIQVLYESPWQAFLITFMGVMTSSALMYITGRVGGYAICKKLLGEEDCNKASELLNDKGAVFFPLMMLFPVFPDDALTMIAGTLKMSLKWFIPSIVIGRGIGIATIIFGLGNIPYDKFTSPWHWIGFISICAVLIALVFYLAFRFNKYLEKRRHIKGNENIMKTNDKVKGIILKWYKALPFDEKYDAEFYSALEEIYIDEAWRIEDYDQKCENGKQNLLAYLYFIEDMKRRYAEIGATEDIFLDSANDIVRWCDAWSETKGELYLGELNWLSLVFKGEILKLGRLQFCFAKEKHNIEKYGIREGDTVLAIHIPAAGPLLLEECKKSVDMAREFFPKHFPDTEFKCFTCHSWLLDPTHSEIMKPTSNILAFQSMFDIVDKSESDSLFGYVFRWKITREEIEDFDCKSSLAKIVREKALSGRKFYAGLGVIEK